MTAVAPERGGGARRLLRQMLSYGVIGALSASLDTLVFWLLVTYTGTHPQLANVVGVLLGISTSFTLNRTFTFDAHDRVVARFASFLAVGIGGLGLSAAILHVGMDLRLPIMAVKVGSVVIVAAVQFVLNRSLSFRPTRVVPDDVVEREAS